MVERAITASSPAPAAKNSDPQQFLGITEGEDVPNACRFSAILHRATASTAGTRLCEGGRHLGVNTNIPTRHLVSTNLGSLLRNVDFVKQSKLQGPDLLKLADMCTYLALPERADVFHQGELANCFYIILKGTAEVKINEKALTGGAEYARDEVRAAPVRRWHGARPAARA